METLAAPCEQLSSCSSSSDCGDELIAPSRATHNSTMAEPSSPPPSPSFTAANVVQAVSSIVRCRSNESVLRSTAANIKAASDLCGSFSWCNGLLFVATNTSTVSANSVHETQKGLEARIATLVAFLQPHTSRCSSNIKSASLSTSFPAIDLIRCLWRFGSSEVTPASIAADISAVLASSSSSLFRVTYSNNSQRQQQVANDAEHHCGEGLSFAVVASVAAVLVAPTLRIRAFLLLALFGITLVNDIVVAIWVGGIRRKLVCRTFALLILLQTVRFMTQQRKFGELLTTSVSPGPSSNERHDKLALRKWLSGLLDALGGLGDHKCGKLSSENTDGDVNYVDQAIERNACRTMDSSVECLTWISSVDQSVFVSGAGCMAAPAIGRLMSDRRLANNFFSLVCTMVTRRGPCEASVSDSFHRLVSAVEDFLCDSLLLDRGSTAGGGAPQSSSEVAIAGTLRTSVLRKYLLELLNDVEVVRESQSRGAGESDPDVAMCDTITNKLQKALNLWSRVGRTTITSTNYLRDNHDAVEAGNSDASPCHNDHISTGCPVSESLEADGLGPPLRPPKPVQIDAGFVRLPALPSHVLRRRQATETLES